MCLPLSCYLHRVANVVFHKFYHLWTGRKLVPRFVADNALHIDMDYSEVVFLAIGHSGIVVAT